MSIAAALFCTILSAQKPQEPVEPPEEDASLIPKEYTLNPVQAKREMTAGDYYFKKGNYLAALQRYTQATLWDNGSPEGFLKLGEAHEKLKEFDKAREAYTKFISLTSDPKAADAIKKKMEKWPAPKK